VVCVNFIIPKLLHNNALAACRLPILSTGTRQMWKELSRFQRLLPG
jgi:hypothetical protein